MRSRLKAHFSLDQMSTTLEDLVETAIMLDYNERDVVGPCVLILNTQKLKNIHIKISIPGFSIPFRLESSSSKKLKKHTHRALAP